MRCQGCLGICICLQMRLWLRIAAACDLTYPMSVNIVGLTDFPAIQNHARLYWNIHFSGECHQPTQLGDSGQGHLQEKEPPDTSRSGDLQAWPGASGLDEMRAAVLTDIARSMHIRGMQRVS